jgi:hypothetical protein
MNTESLVKMYQNGAITAGDLVLRSLDRIDPTDPAMALHPLPHEILLRALEFARCYKPNGMASNYGNVPRPDQVEAAKKWIEATLLADPVALKIR